MVDSRVLKTIIAEAGGDPEAMQAVAAVIFNRAQQTGKTPLQVVQQKGQFEGYSNPGPAISKQLNDSRLLAKAQDAYAGISSGTIADPTNGGTMYHASYVTPYWAKSANKNGTVNIGGNIFYKGSAPVVPQTAIQAINSSIVPPPGAPDISSYVDTNPHIPSIIPPRASSITSVEINPNGTLKAQPSVPLPRPNPMIAPGNLNLDQRQVYNAPDGTYRTENSISIGTDQGEVLIPTIVNGKQVSNQDAIAHYMATGENLGTFPNPATADSYAQQLHLRQEKAYAPQLQTLAPPNLPLNPPLPPLPPDTSYGPATGTRWGPRIDQLSVPSAPNTTAEGLSIRPVQSVAIDPMTGNPVSSGGTSPDLQTALNALAASRAAALPLSGANSTTSNMAGSVAMPPGIVPKSVQSAFATMPRPPSGYLSASGSSGGNMGQWGAAGLTSAPYIPGPSGTTVANKDASQLPDLPVDAYGPTYGTPATAAITKVIANPAYTAFQAAHPVGNDTMDSHGAKVNVQANPYAPTITVKVPGPTSIPTVPVPSYRPPAALPLTQFSGVNPMTQLVPRVQSGFASTPMGHIGQLLMGEPVQGGILGFLSGLFKPPAAGQPAAPYVPASVAGTGFLNAQGINTANMNAAQVSQALRDALASSSRQSGSGPGSQ